MLITVRGRVESDPMRVPQAASMTTGFDAAFEQVLQQTVAAEEAVAERPVAKAEPATDETAATETTSSPPVADEATEAEPSLHESPTPAGDEVTGHSTLGSQAEVTNSIRRGEPGRQETAGKGTDSPRTSPTTSEPLLAAFVQQRAMVPAAPTISGTTGKVEGITAARGAEASGRSVGLGGAATRHNAPLQAPATAASYRTSGAATAEMLEQARDSVFKQILLKLNGDGGEMRLHLDPPELGELDLRLVVESGNRLALTMAAERPEMTDLLQRHLDELKQALQAAGLEVSGASVQTRSEFAREQKARDEAFTSNPDAAGQPDDDDTTITPARGGYVSATGLDFWA